SRSCFGQMVSGHRGKGDLILASLLAPLLCSDEASVVSSGGVDNGHDPAVGQFSRSPPPVFSRRGMRYVFLLDSVWIGEGAQGLFKGDPVLLDVGVILLVIPLHYVHSVSPSRGLALCCEPACPHSRSMERWTKN